MSSSSPKCDSGSGSSGGGDSDSGSGSGNGKGNGNGSGSGSGSVPTQSSSSPDSRQPRMRPDSQLATDVWPLADVTSGFNGAEQRPSFLAILFIVYWWLSYIGPVYYITLAKLQFLIFFRLIVRYLERCPLLLMKRGCREGC